MTIQVDDFKSHLRSLRASRLGVVSSVAKWLVQWFSMVFLVLAQMSSNTRASNRVSNDCFFSHSCYEVCKLETKVPLTSPSHHPFTFQIHSVLRKKSGPATHRHGRAVPASLESRRPGAAPVQMQRLGTVPLSGKAGWFAAFWKGELWEKPIQDHVF